MATWSEGRMLDSRAASQHGNGRTQLRDEAAAYVRELILSGQAAPGTLLRLAPLAEQIGASVTPVREALLLLARDGWLMLEPNRGFRVAPLRRGDLVDAYLIYAYGAGVLAERAAARITDAELQALREVNVRLAMLPMPSTGGVNQVIVSLNYQLHGLIYRAADSPRMTWFVNSASEFVPRRFWGMVPGWYELNRDGHTPIVDALGQHDSGVAASLMREHIAQAEALLLSHLDSISFWEAAE